MISDATVIGAFVFMVGLLALVCGAYALVSLARAWADDRRREAEYARAWQETHRQHQDRGRYTTDWPGRPE